MEITEISVKLLDEPEGPLQAYCSITFDDEFAVKDLKIIKSAEGTFVAMPSRKVSTKCFKCGGKNHLKARFCNDCGTRLDMKRGQFAEAQSKLYVDVAHPINPTCREKIEKAVLDAYREECEKAKGQNRS
ncbi:MAG: SpoVG family protein [Planctomycetota bacterium]